MATRQDQLRRLRRRYHREGELHLRHAEFTPPVIYSLEERAKLVFLIEALPDKPDSLRVGQPVDVTLLPKVAAQ